MLKIRSLGKTPFSASTVVWVVILALLLLAVGAQLIAAAEVALNYWYILSIPLMVGALRFGTRGAIITSAFSILIVVVVFYVAGRTFEDLTRPLEELIVSSTSPLETRNLALQLADLRSSDPDVAFRRALAGLALVIVSCMLLGRAVDARERSAGLLEKVVGILRRYFSPQIVDAITLGAYDGSMGAISVRKEVTMLFADLRGFTAFCERSQPEEIISLLNDYFNAMTEEVLRYHGTLDKYIGDAIMAFFGDPEEDEEHAEHAFQAAIAMQARMRELQSRWIGEGRTALGMGIGLCTGHVTVGNMGSSTLMCYTAIGSAVNVAARLSELAKSGQILTTLKTYWHVQPIMDGVQREPTEVRGFVRPVEIVELVGPRLVVGARRRAVSQWLVQIATQLAEDPFQRALILANRPEVFSVMVPSQEQRELAIRVAKLCRFPQFRELPPRELALLMEPAVIVTDLAGTIVAHPGAAEDMFYIILDGEVDVIVSSEEPTAEADVTTLGAGDYFGEVTLLYDTARTETVRARVDSTFLALHRDNFYTLLQEAPALRTQVEATAQSRLGESDTAFSPEEAALRILPLRPSRPLAATGLHP